MKRVRHTVPLLAILALAALFFSLPETPNAFGIFACKSCSSSSPYLPLIGSGYFAALIALSLLFPAFPGRALARGGLIWAVLLAAVLTYIHLPTWCPACLLCHTCNIVIWTIWVAIPSEVDKTRASTFRERLCVAVFAPLSVVALFSSLNLTFMAYGFKTNVAIATASLKPGDALPSFVIRTTDGRLIASADTASTAGIFINFISPDCPYCKEQLVIIDAVSNELASSCFINVSSRISPELIQRSPACEWVEDREGHLRNLFKITAYPTLFVVRTDGKIAQVIPGVPEHLKELLLTAKK